MRIAFERGSIEIHVKTIVGATRTTKSFSRNDLDACPHLQSLRLNRIAMSDGRFVSVAIAIAGEGELPTVNWQIVCMSDERFTRN